MFSEFGYLVVLEMRNKLCQHLGIRHSDGLVLHGDRFPVQPTELIDLRDDVLCVVLG